MNELTITPEKLVSASISLKSGGWTDYEIKATAQVYESTITSFQTGEVKKLSDNKIVATFYTMQNGAEMGDNLNINYNLSGSDAQCEVNRKINEFITFAKNQPPKYMNL